MEPDSPPRRIPAKNIKKIDPEKFLGGRNLDKFKGLIKDAESFISTVKGRSKDIEDTFDRLRDVTTKFGETVDFMYVIAEANKQIFEKMLQNMERSINRIPEGKDGQDS